ncbi:MAG: hypothetical protein RL354_2181, partial [Planctomycetota bacterium]
MTTTLAAPSTVGSELHASPAIDA